MGSSDFDADPRFLQALGVSEMIHIFSDLFKDILIKSSLMSLSKLKSISLNMPLILFSID